MTVNESYLINPYLIISNQNNYYLFLKILVVLFTNYYIILKLQTNIFLKPKIPEKTLISNNSTKHTNQTSINNSKNSYKNSHSSSGVKSKNNTLENLSVTKNDTKQQSKLKTTINSTNNSADKSKLKTSLLSKSKENVKAIKQSTPQIPKNKTATKHVSIIKEIKKKNISASKTALNKSNNKSVNTIKSKTKKCDKSLNGGMHKKLKGEKSKTKQVDCPNSSSTEVDLFGCLDHADYGNVSDYNIMASPGKLSVASGNDQSRSMTPPLFSYQWNSTAKSLAISEPPTPLSKSIEAKALKRVKAPKITLEDEMKYNKKQNNKRSIDFKTASNKINKMLEFGNDEDDED